MQFLKIFAIILCVIQLILTLTFAVKSKRAIRHIALSVAIGLVSLALVNLTTKFTGVHIPINWYSVGASSLFSLPGVCGLLILNIMM